MKGSYHLKRHQKSPAFQPLRLPASMGRYNCLYRLLQRPLERLLGLPRINDIYAQAAAAPDQWFFLVELLQGLQVRYEAGAPDLASIPPQGPLVVVANHPFGGLEGIILPLLLGQVRRDVKVLANHLLRPVRELQDLFIYVDPFGSGAATNLAGFREALRWLGQGGVVALFPAGEVSHLRWPALKVADPVWSRSVARLVRKSGADVLPVFFSGCNSWTFLCLGLVHPWLRTALLPRETLNKRHRTLQVKIGRIIPRERALAPGGDAAVTDYLRLRTEMLQESFPGAPVPSRRPRLLGRPLVPEDLAAPLDPAALAREVQALPSSQALAGSGSLVAYIAEAGQVPLVLQEIGRLRELTFRQVQEGTGRAVDLDRFDAYYLHLFLWHQEAREVVGAYRLGRADRIVAQMGREGLYTATLFDFREEFLAGIQPALELGRSFIRAEYQKNYSALLLLWKGIGQYLVRHPHYQRLFGPVSISNAYSNFSQGLLATWLSMHSFLPELACFVRPRHPLATSRFRDRELRLALAGTDGVEELSALVAEVEPNRQGVPILLKHYLKLGGKLLGFNRDPKFNNVLDGLILVDLLQTPAPVLQRYLGKDGLAAFFRHRQGANRPTAPPPAPGRFVPAWT